MNIILASAIFSFLLMSLNTLLLYFVWKLNLKFKQRFLSSILGFIKFPVILISIYWAYNQKWFNSVGATIGICAFLIIIVSTVLIKKNRF